MNTIKNNFDNQIKKQIEEREITPSRDLWSEIKNQTQNDRPKSKLNWFLVAACLILLCSLGSVLFFYNKSGQPEVQMVGKKNSPAIKKNTEEIESQPDVLVAHDQKDAVEIKKTEPIRKIEAPAVQASADHKNALVVKENIPPVTSDISETPPVKIIAKTDSAKIPTGRKRYVDPSTLLFSVEHKDAIEKTKGKSNVATIDLNGK
ncbi:hypothetical protein CEY12_13490 [Chryseobacterium sp. T16E-39]|uniref:hypothetical protein n=1 Tax=Chryseobacterium sp. T16E-39 TaxID=2015076 RepID=UPI000B5B4039|nr:hypothetical protein [Chryseobacterium sp. T16E-39]ASK31057.1 hypothetical protein CEY12_13490 [Chryseobacterium sp. T16E-39]